MQCLLCHSKISRLRTWKTKSEFCSDEHAEVYKRQTLERLFRGHEEPEVQVVNETEAPSPSAAEDNISVGRDLEQVRQALDQLEKRGGLGALLTVEGYVTTVTKRSAAVDTTEQPHQRIPGRAKGMIWIAPDFDDPLPEDVIAEFEK